MINNIHMEIHRYLYRIDLRILPFLFALMAISLYVIGSTTADPQAPVFFTAHVKSQILRYALGFAIFLFFTCFDYRKLREYSVFLYIATIILLLGLFLTDPIQNVRRWYRVPVINFAFQPSEYAKLILVITLSWFLERKKDVARDWRVSLQALAFVLLPFLLILKQPDLGTALVLLPVTLSIFYFGGISKKVVGMMTLGALASLGFVLMLFLGVISHAETKPYVTKVIKEYQYERLNPETYHQKASKTAIALGHWKGSGWNKSEFSSKQWLPAAHTDSVFSAFTEETGFFGAAIVLLLFSGLIYFSFQVTAVASDAFGRLLAAGIAVYLAVHVVVNVGMMCGLLPITGVPLILVTYGGSSVFSTMAALGILQSIYVRRYLF